MNQLLFLLLMTTSLLSHDLTGIWNLKSEPNQPFNFANLVGYKAKVKFNSDGTLIYLGREGKIMGSVRYYTLNKNELNVFQQKPNKKSVKKTVADKLSSNDFLVKSISNECMNVISLKDESSPFTMCKEK